MEVGKKEAIICKKYDKNENRNAQCIIYMIDETLAHDYITAVQQKEEYKNRYLVKNFLPKDLFQKVEKNTQSYLNPNDQYKIDKAQQFRIWKYDIEPYYLQNALSSINTI